jgi:FxsC-like protein
MSDTGNGRDGLGTSGSYFYLSYAQSPPLAGQTRVDPDQWVIKFFEDLSAAVGRLASPGSDLRPGIFDLEIPLGSDWKASLMGALSAAEVFVPLYSPAYFARSWPGKEWACFSQRMASRVPDPLRRFVPVLWTPLPGDQDRPELQELLAVPGAEQAYTENGLRALLRLRPYREAYQLVVDDVAARIVRLARDDRLGPSPAPDINGVRSAFNPEASGAVFAVTVAAPVLASLPPGRDRAGYGDSSDSWRPFPNDQELSLADYALLLAEQMDFAVLFAGVTKSGDRLTSRPGILIIDPWFIADDRGLANLQAFVKDLPPWVLPLPVLGSNRDATLDVLAERVRAILTNNRSNGSEPAGRAIRGVSSLTDFVALMPTLVAEAERQYLRRDLGPQFTGQAERSWRADG